MFFLACAICPFVHGQEPPAENKAPDPPHLARVPAYTQWTVTAINVPSKPETPEQEKVARERIHWNPMLQKIEFRKDDKNLHAIFSWEGGKRTEGYLIGKFFYSQVTPRTPEHITFQESGDRRTGTADYLRTDFPDLAWVSAENFVQTAPFEGRKAHLYELRQTEAEKNNERMEIDASVLATGGTVSDPVSSSGTGESVLARAWIDATTRLPLASSGKKYNFRYAFQSGPHTKIILSKPFADYIANLEAERRSPSNQP